MHNRKMFDLENEEKSHDYTDHNCSIRWQIPMSIKVVLEHFTLPLTVSIYSHFKFRYLGNVGQSDIQYLQSGAIRLANT